MAAPEYVPRPAAEKPRVYESPPHRPGGWRQDRPSEVIRRQPSGGRLGHQGPDQGYALRLARHFDEQLVLTAGEHRDDVVAGCLGVATKRASSFGRAPVIHDLTIAFTVWGFLSESPAELVALRRGMFESAHHIHHDSLRRAIADAVPDAVLRRSPAEVEAQWRIDWSSCLEIPVERPPVRPVGAIAVARVVPLAPVDRLLEVAMPIDGGEPVRPPPELPPVPTLKPLDPATVTTRMEIPPPAPAVEPDGAEETTDPVAELAAAAFDVDAEVEIETEVEATFEEPAAASAPLVAAVDSAAPASPPPAVRRTSDLGGVGVDPKETLQVDRDEVRGALAEVRAEMAASAATTTAPDDARQDRFAVDDTPADFGIVDELERFSSPTTDSPPSQRTPIAPVPVKSSSLFSRAAAANQEAVVEVVAPLSDATDVPGESNAPTEPAAEGTSKPAPVRPVPVRKPLTHQDEEEVARLLAQARRALHKPKN